MTEVAKSVISIELDATSLAADSAKAEAIFTEFADRMQKAANITLRHETDKNGKVVIKVDVDPKTTKAGMEVINGIVKEYTSRLSREAKIGVGVDTKAIRTIDSAFKALKEKVIYGTLIGIGQAFAFTLSRGIENALQALIKTPIKYVTAAIAAAGDQQRAEEDLAKAIGVTGQQSGKTKDELLKTAKALEALTNVSDNVIIAMQGIFVSAKNITGDNFDRATKAALDMADKLGGDPVNKAKQLGKALQEPVKGLEMLRDAGVAFTEQQNKVVKYFVKVNDIASAQGILLDEIESKYADAGTATATFGDKLDEAGIRFDNVKERMGQFILLNDASFIPAIDAGIDAVEAYTPAAVGLAGALSRLAAAVLDYSIEGDRANLTTDEMILKSSEWRSAIIANWQTESIIANAKRRLAQAGAAILAPKGVTLLNEDGSVADVQNEDLAAGSDLQKTLEDEADAQLKIVEDNAVKVEQAAIDARDKRKKQQKEDEEQRQEDFRKRQEENKKRIDEAYKLVLEDERLEEEAKLKKKRLKKEEAAEDKRLKEEERARLKAQQDYEKSMGRDSLVGLHQRIQDAMYLRREEAKKNKQVETADKVVKDKPVFAPEDPVKWGIPWVKQQEEKAKKQEQEEQALKDRDAREARFKKDEAAEIALKGKEEQKPVTQEDVDNAKARLKEIADYNSKALANSGIVAGSMNKEGQTLSYFDQNNEVRSLEAKLREQTTTKKGDNKVVEDSAKKTQDAEAKAFDEKRAADEAALQAAIAEEAKKKQTAKDRDAAERKLVDDAIGMRMTPEQEKAFWDANKPAMDLNHSKAIDKIMGAEKQAEEKKAWDESGGPEKAAQEYEKQRKENEERRRRFSEGRTPEQQDNLRRMLEGMPPLSSATPPCKRKRSFAPEGGTPSFAPEGGDIKVTVKPEQKEVVSSITTQTRILSKAITESRKLT